MKQQNLRVSFGLLFSVLLLSYFSASARLLLPKQDEKEAKAIDIAHGRLSTEFKYDMELMGSEECDTEDEECCERRMISEAHLDYIYTQHHKPAYAHKP